MSHLDAGLTWFSEILPNIPAELQYHARLAYSRPGCAIIQLPGQHPPIYAEWLGRPIESPALSVRFYLPDFGHGNGAAVVENLTWHAIPVETWDEAVALASNSRNTQEANFRAALAILESGS